MNPTRIDKCFERVKQNNKKALITFITAGDPDYETSAEILNKLPAAGADIIELGMPFSDPMADGPAIQASSLRALKAGQDMNKTLQMVKEFRKTNNETPIVLMGYYNPIYHYKVDRFLDAASDAGIDGLIVVDIPPEADDELCLPARDKNISLIRLAAPTTDDRRLPTVLQNTSGFVYYVSIAGITGTRAPDVDAVKAQVQRIKGQTELPVVVGFGIKTPEQAATIGAHADGVVVGSALVNAVSDSLTEDNQATPNTVPGVISIVEGLSKGLA